MRLPSPKRYFEERVWRVANLRAERVERRIEETEDRLQAMSRHRAALSHYRHFVEPGDLVFDLGANVGARTALFRELGSTVVAVEPQPSAVEALRARFGDDPRVTVVEKAVAAAPGTYTLMVGTDDALSSISPEWIEAMRASGRFGGAEWSGSVEVAGTTLDALIEEFGLPQFCKIDVEGYEAEVLKGLSRPLPSASFEFAAEAVDRITPCIEAFADLGPCEFALSYEESMWLGRWEPAEQIIVRLRSFPDQLPWGDVYVRSRA
jgi:FkbM family methyltransferase